MDVMLSPEELRVLGCLIEKELTTPEYYPLSVNALTLACNQKTNREPVMLLGEADVLSCLERLRQAGLAHRSAEGGRVSRHAHNVGSKLSLDEEELAVLGVLLLRGPQTAGEVRTRAERMHTFTELSEVEAVLQRLMEGDTALVARLERLPGRKEPRYVQLLGGRSPAEVVSHAETPSVVSASQSDRVTRLEEEVATLRAELNVLKQELRDFKAQLE